MNITKTTRVIAALSARSNQLQTAFFWDRTRLSVCAIPCIVCSGFCRAWRGEGRMDGVESRFLPPVGGAFPKDTPQSSRARRLMGRPLTEAVGSVRTYEPVTTLGGREAHELLPE